MLSCQPYEHGQKGPHYDADEEVLASLQLHPQLLLRGQLSLIGLQLSLIPGRDGSPGYSEDSRCKA